MSPEERQECLMGGLTIRGVLGEMLSAGLAEWMEAVEREEGIEVAEDEMDMEFVEGDGSLYLRIGTQRWRIQAEEIAP